MLREAPQTPGLVEDVEMEAQAMELVVETEESMNSGLRVNSSNPRPAGLQQSPGRGAAFGALGTTDLGS